MKTIMEKHLHGFLANYYDYDDPGASPRRLQTNPHKTEKIINVIAREQIYLPAIWQHNQ